MFSDSVIVAHLDGNYIKFSWEKMCSISDIRYHLSQVGKPRKEMNTQPGSQNV